MLVNGKRGATWDFLSLKRRDGGVWRTGAWLCESVSQGVPSLGGCISTFVSCAWMRLCMTAIKLVFSRLGYFFPPTPPPVTDRHHSVYVIHCTAFIITRRNNQVFMFVITPLSKIFCYIFYLWYLFVARCHIILIVCITARPFSLTFHPCGSLSPNRTYGVTQQALTWLLKCLMKSLCWYPAGQKRHMLTICFIET